MEHRNTSNSPESGSRVSKNVLSVNGSMRRPFSTVMISSAGATATATTTTTTSRPQTTILDSSPHHQSPHHPPLLRVVINRDEKGYGMKVSGDKPVYVQSVKEGGAAERAGLHADDKIIQVNGIDVMESTHTEVVALIRSSHQVVLTVQQKPRGLGSPSLHTRPLPIQSSTTTITGPKPADNEKLKEFQMGRVKTFQLMLEKEQRYVDTLRSELARSPGDEKKLSALSNAERNVGTLQNQLQTIILSSSGQNEQSFNNQTNHTKQSMVAVAAAAMTLPVKKTKTRPVLPHSLSSHFPDSSTIPEDVDPSPPPPPLLPKRIKSFNQHHMNHNSNPMMCDLMVSGVNCPAPPLPPRNENASSDPDAVNSINKQMSYPLIATCATLVNNYPAQNVSNHTNHHRTKSNPDPISIMSPSEASRRLIASESLNDLSRSTDGWDLTSTPPGTPPPPYPSPIANKRIMVSNRNSANTEDGEEESESPEISPLRGVCSGTTSLSSSPIVAASTNKAQQPIISMEDDEISDQEVGQLEDHGPFKSLSRLWEHTPHLAVFMNYVLSNSDPSSLLFYLLTDLYKEGNAKDMRKWAYEIHSSFLVPGAPLRLSNVDENIAREIDEVLLKEWDKEEILRKIFWKTRNRAKEELNDQLADFQQKRTAGLGTIFGPTDVLLEEISHDKAKEMKLYETLLLTKLDPYLDELEKERTDPRRYLTAAALATVITKVFGVRSTHTTHALERCPTFISKDKSFRKLIGRYSRKLNVSGHHYVAQHYYTVISCNNCHQIIYGIGPQGYQCSVCLINLHRQCVKQYDDSCPGPISKKDRGIGKFMERIRPESKDSRRKPSAYFINMEREKRLIEERDTVPDSDQISCERQPSQPVSRSASDKRRDAVNNEEVSIEEHDTETVEDVTHNNSLPNVQRAKSSQPAINRSESYKEQSQKRRQIRERRKVSDPNLSKSNDVDSDHHQELSYRSGSSSNSSLSSSRSSESPPSTSLDTVAGCSHAYGTTAWDSDIDIEPDPPDWQSSVSEEILSRLHPEEKKRQEIINELFHTERSHVRNLKVLESVFYRPLLQSKCLPHDQVRLLFPNLEEMLEIHGAFNAAMKARRKEEAVIEDIGELLLNMFDGSTGENFQQAAAKFCARQQLALESLKEKRRKDPRLNSFLADCEGDKLCKRLQLKDIIPTGMQRLVKYPLLFESLTRCTERVLESTMMDSLPASSSTPLPPPTTQLELTRLKRAVERSKEILNYVNQAVKEAEDKARLQDLQKRLDKTSFEKVEHPISVEFRSVDLTKHKLIHEGPLLWRLNKQKLNIHVVLLEEIILLLHKQDEKFVLKFHSSAGPNATIVTHSPIVKVSTVLVRQNASEKDSLYLVNTAQNGAQIYDLSAQSPSDYKIWFKHISDAAEAYKCREGKSRRSELFSPEPEGTDPSASDLNLNAISDIGSSVDTQSNTDTDSNLHSGENSQRNSGIVEEEEENETEKQRFNKQMETETENQSGSTADDTIGLNSKREAHMRLATDDQLLIQPSEVTVNVLPVHTAQPVVTPIEQVRRKDEAIRQALSEKEALVAEILHLPPEDYHTIADMAGDVRGSSPDKEPTELVLAAINQANQLWSVVSESLNITETDAVLATTTTNSSPGGGGQVAETQSCSSLKNSLVSPLPSIPSHIVQNISNTLNTQLTALLKVVKEREDERERMRKELQKLREQLHVINEPPPPQSMMMNNDAEIFHSTGDLANIEEDP